MQTRKWQVPAPEVQACQARAHPSLRAAVSGDIIEERGCFQDSPAGAVECARDAVVNDNGDPLAIDVKFHAV